MEGADLLPWQTLHRGRVAALDICADTREVGHAFAGNLFVAIVCPSVLSPDLCCRLV